ncbi:MAG: AAA family ATPase [Clostridiales bacterium]|nr:AAA family ATPase [Clostridiales bacterium]
MIQSELYKKVLEYAFGMCRKDGKASVNADYFVTALLNLVLAESRAELDVIPEIYIYNKSAVKKELADVGRIFSRYNIDLMDVAVKLESAVRQSPASEAAGAKFQVLERAAVDKVSAAGKSELTTTDMLEIMLDDPTEYIGAYITSAGKKPEQEQPQQTEQPQQDEQPQQQEQSQQDEQSAVADAVEYLKSVLFDDITAPDENNDNEVLPDSDHKRAFAPRRQNTDSDRYGGYGAPTVQPRTVDDPMPTEKTSAKLTLMEHAKNVKNIQNKLLDKVFGQDLAVEMFVSGYFQAELVSMIMKGRKKPRATFLFAGPPGVGKTFLAESAAEVLGLPFKRFDMSEYSNNESGLEFAGTDKVYKGAHEGAVTGFVAKNPRCILLFDEVEKAHLNVIHLFLQILDAGRLRDTFTECEVDFSDAIIILTTNAGKKLYEDPDIINLSGVPRKTILRALATEQRTDGTPFFPEAVCSRFASGNVVMFNRLGAHDLLNIAGKELKVHAEALREKAGVEIEIDNDINYTVLYSEGGKADARAIRGKAVNFFYRELYEFYRLASSDKKASAFNKIVLSVEPSGDKKIAELFAPAVDPEVLIFADDLKNRCEDNLSGITTHFASDLETAKNIIVENDISVIICDVKCGQRSGRRTVLNLEDIDSEGRDFFNYVSQNVAIPLYVLDGGYDITSEELLSFSRNGAMGVISLNSDDENGFCAQILEKCNIAKQQRNMKELSRSRKILSYQTAQSFEGETAKITLFDLQLSVAVDAEDDSVLSGMSRPDVKFGDVIGAEDAKRELGYFTEFLRNPKLFAKNGVRPPNGILLYGPPGTGKTLLAKALAGESDVTYIAAEGNGFLSKYVGEGPRLVHELFATARKYAPAVLFIDEIDAVGISRADLSADNDTTSEILTALLTEMDGFKSHPDRPVFVLAATNVGVDGSGKKQLDPALLRRFDRRIMVDLPNKAERERFLRMQCERNQNVKLSDAQIANLAVRSTGMSLADLASITEMALRDALKTPDFAVTDDVMEEAFESYNSGEVKKWSDDTLLRTARHECGHALMCWLGGETPSYMTIVARDSHGGYMQHADREDKQIYTKADMLAIIRTALGGRAAELVYYGDEDGVTTGPSGDLAHATSVAEGLICTYGMDEKIGLGSIDPAKIMYTPYYSVIRDRVNEILDEQLQIAKRAIAACKPAIDELVSVLLDNNKLKGEQIDEILKKFVDRD